MIRLDQPWQAGGRARDTRKTTQEPEPPLAGTALPALPPLPPGDALAADTPPSQLLAEHLRRSRQAGDAARRPRLEPGVYRGSDKLKGFGTLVTAGDAGIGRAVAWLFAREGADVAIVYPSAHEDAEETRRCVEGEGTRCLLLRGDVSDEVWCQRAVQRVTAAFGRIDVLVNCATFAATGRHLGDQDELLWQLPQDAVLRGYFHMARAALPFLPRGGSIINTVGLVAGDAGAQRLDDAATRGAIQAFTQSLAGRLQGRGIRVNAVAPGPAHPDRASPAYVFLAAPACSGAISGLVLPVVGGIDET